MKKAYYRISLQVHPDRVAEADKVVATEKFKVLSKVNGVLTDANKRALYDDKGIIDDDDDDSTCDWATLWKLFFKPIKTSDIDKYQREYVGSELERSDVKKSYLRGKGCINFLHETVPFMQVESEPRIAVMVREWIDAGEVPDYPAFTNEPAAKRKRRHQKRARETLEAEAINKKQESKCKKAGLSLEEQIQKRQMERASSAGVFFDQLIKKYEDVDDDDDEDDDNELTLDDLLRREKKGAGKRASKRKGAEPKCGKSARVSKAKK